MAENQRKQNALDFFCIGRQRNIKSGFGIEEGGVMLTGRSGNVRKLRRKKGLYA